MKLSGVRALFLALVVAFAPAALAHGDPDKPAHGGISAKDKDYTLELVARPDAITVYVTDHGKKVDTKGASGELTLLSGKDKQSVKLAPAGDNALAAKGSFAVGAGTRAVARVTVGKQTVQVRYSIK